DSSPLTQKIVQEWVRRSARIAKVKPEGVHVLRHTFCSHLAMRGAPARAIQELAGHVDLTTTQRYMHLSPAAIEGAIRLLESAGVRPSSGDISNDVGSVKRHHLRSGRRRRPCSSRSVLSMSTPQCSEISRLTHGVAHHTSLRSQRDHDVSCEPPTGG